MTGPGFDERGILTDADVKFLQGTAAPSSSQQRSRARQRIRNRVAAALYDFETLRTHWPIDQQRKTLTTLTNADGKSVEELGAEAVGFLYSFLNSATTQPNIILDDDPVTQLLRFRAALTRGIRKGKQSFDADSGVVSIAATTPLYESPDPSRVRDHISSDILTDAHRKMNQKYRNSGLYEDDELIVDDRDNAIQQLYAEWSQLITSEVMTRRQRAGDFLRPPGTAVTSTRGYREEFKTHSDADST